MNLLIIENQFSEMEPLFDALKEDYPDLNYTNISSSQQLKPFESILKYDKILVDLKLTDRTKLEGYDILIKLKELKYDMNNVAIVTAHTGVASSLKDRNLTDIKVIEKPFYLDELESFLGY